MNEIHWPSFGWGVFSTAVSIFAGEWLLFHYWPVDRSKDAEQLARKDAAKRRAAFNSQR